MRKQILLLFIVLMPSLLVGCEYKYAKTRPPEILVSPYQKVQAGPGGGDPVWIFSADPEKLFIEAARDTIQTARDTGYFLNLETGEKLPAPTGFHPGFRTEHLILSTATVPMGGHQGPFRIDLHGKTVVSEEAMGPGWGDKSPPIRFIKRERFTGEMLLVVNGLPVLRQQVADMYLREIYIDYNLEFGIVIFRDEPEPDGEPFDKPRPEAYYLIRIPVSHEVKPQPKPQVSGGVMGGRLNPIPNPSDKKRK